MLERENLMDRKQYRAPSYSNKERYGKLGRNNQKMAKMERSEPHVLSDLINITTADIPRADIVGNFNSS